MKLQAPICIALLALPLITTSCENGLIDLSAGNKVIVDDCAITGEVVEMTPYHILFSGSAVLPSEKIHSEDQVYPSVFLSDDKNVLENASNLFEMNYDNLYVSCMDDNGDPIDLSHNRSRVLAARTPIESRPSHNLIPGKEYYWCVAVVHTKGRAVETKKTVFHRGEIKSFVLKDFEPLLVDRDLGLSVQWFVQNRGANNASDKGHCYTWANQWADNPPLDIDTPIYIYDRYRIALRKMNDDIWLTGAGECILPSYEEVEELAQNCTWGIQETEDGPLVCGVSKINGHKIYFPTAQEEDMAAINSGPLHISHSYYWTCTSCSDDPRYAWAYYVSEKGITFSKIRKDAALAIRRLRKDLLPPTPTCKLSILNVDQNQEGNAVLNAFCILDNFEGYDEMKYRFENLRVRVSDHLEEWDEAQRIDGGIIVNAEEGSGYLGVHMLNTYISQPLAEYEIPIPSDSDAAGFTFSQVFSNLEKGKDYYFQILCHASPSTELSKLMYVEETTYVSVVYHFVTPESYEGHDYVEIQPGVKIAVSNVGAETPWNLGEEFVDPTSSTPWGNKWRVPQFTDYSSFIVNNHVFPLFGFADGLPICRFINGENGKSIDFPCTIVETEGNLVGFTFHNWIIDENGTFQPFYYQNAGVSYRERESGPPHYLRLVLNE